MKLHDLPDSWLKAVFLKLPLCPYFSKVVGLTVIITGSLAFD